jgi:glycosyltransferase involved in cell wall biosynthesis
VDHDSDLLASAYAACDTFVLPSLFETPGIAALEAGLSGAKVVITPHGGPREYFGSMADYVNPYDVQDIRRGILKALDRPRNDVLATHIAARFLWKHVAIRTAEVYTAALGR